MKQNNTMKVKELATVLNLNQMQLNEYPVDNSREIDLSSDCILFCGDNEEVMRCLKDKLIDTVDFCYIDPPYNTKSSFIYDDARIGDRKSLFGSHTEWMKFMLPRLQLVHILLRKEGVIAISIDDYEQPYLRLLLDTVFGEENFIGNIVTCRSKNGKGGRANIATNHEYVVVYGKSKNSKLIGTPDIPDSYNKEDEYGKFKVDGLFRKKGDASKREDRPNMYYPLYFDKDGKVFTKNVTGSLKEVYPVDSQGIERRWLWGKEKATEESWKLFASKSGVIYVKNYSNPEKRTKIRTIWTSNSHLTERATKEVKEIFGDKIFETPKPIALIEDIIESHTGKDSLIIDFFAGTGTTAHAAHNLNKRDSGNRKVILIEQNVKIPEKHIAYKLGYKTISDITKGRLEHIKSLDEKFDYKVVNFQNG